jgi:hypothetical protein
LAPTLREMAEAHQCELLTLRSRRGPVCLILIPCADADESMGGGKEEEEEGVWRARVRAAREALLPLLEELRRSRVRAAENGAAVVGSTEAIATEPCNIEGSGGVISPPAH